MEVATRHCDERSISRMSRRVELGYVGGEIRPAVTKIAPQFEACLASARQQCATHMVERGGNT